MGEPTMTMDPGLFVFALIATACVAVLLGAALGYFTASTDLVDEKRRAWDRGFLAGMRSEESVRLGKGSGEHNPFVQGSGRPSSSSRV